MTRLTMAVLAWACLTGWACGAETQQNHQVDVRTDAETCIKIMDQNRDQLMQAAGVQIVQKLPNGIYVVQVNKFRFSIREEKVKIDGSASVRWSLVGRTDNIAAYRSRLDCFDNGHGTTVKGTIFVQVNGGRIVDKHLDAGVRDGIGRMQRQLRRLLQE